MVHTLLVSSRPWHAISLWENGTQQEPCELGTWGYFASFNSRAIQPLLRLGQSGKSMMLTLLEVLKHSQIIHYGHTAAALAISRVLLLPELSSDLLASHLVGSMGWFPSFSLILSTKTEHQPLFCKLLQLFDKYGFCCSKNMLLFYVLICFLLLYWCVGH